MSSSQEQLSSKLKALPNFFEVDSKAKADLVAKKRARLEVSLQYSSDKVGFLHAVCIEVAGNYFLLAGPSKIGKSTYAHYLTQQYGGRIVVNDWVGVEFDDDDEFYYFSDINFEEHIKHSERCPVSGIFFLSKTDCFGRDAFAPNDEEFFDVLALTFDTASSEEVDILSQFWFAHRNSLPFCHVVPTRQDSEEKVAQTLVSLIERQSLDTSQIGIIGLGALGQALAFQLGQSSEVSTVHLHNRGNGKEIGLAMDLNQAYPQSETPRYEAHLSPDDVFLNASVVFMCFRGFKPEVPDSTAPFERWGKAKVNALIMDEYAQSMANTGFSGTVLTLSNPVELLSKYLHTVSQTLNPALRTYQVYALGLELEIARTLYFAEAMGLSLTPQDITVFGNHSDNFVLKTPLTQSQNDALFEQVKGASSSIREYVERTVYGPAMAALQSLQAFWNNSETTLAVLQEGSIIGHQVKFDKGLPLFPKDDHTEYACLLEQNKQNFATYLGSPKPTASLNS